MIARYTQSCPTCGRRIQIRTSLIGETVACTHCHGEFVATTGPEVPVSHPSADDTSKRNAGSTDLVPAIDPLMQRVERMLAESSVSGL